MAETDANVSSSNLMDEVYTEWAHFMGFTAISVGRGKSRGLPACLVAGALLHIIQREQHEGMHCYM